MNDATAEILERYMSAIQLGTDLSDRDLGAIEMAMLLALTDCEGSVRRQLSDANAHIEFLRRSLDERGELLHDLSVELAALHQSMSEPVPAAPAATEAAPDFTQPEPEAIPTPADFGWRYLAQEDLDTIADLELGQSWRKTPQEIRERIVRAAVAELVDEYGPDLSMALFDTLRPYWMPTISGLLNLTGVTWSQLKYQVTP
jgi:hypothetical protein